MNDADLASFCVDGSALATHPEHVLPWVDFSTGSLGLGLSFAVGAALAARIQGSRRRAFALLSDAECNEGSVWEAVMLAVHHGLGNVIALVDVNGQQALGYTRDVLDLAPLATRWKAFGWDVHEVDGHDVDSLTRTMQHLAEAMAKRTCSLPRPPLARCLLHGKHDRLALPADVRGAVRAGDERAGGRPMVNAPARAAQAVRAAGLTPAERAP